LLLNENENENEQDMVRWKKRGEIRHWMKERWVLNDKESRGMMWKRLCSHMGMEVVGRVEGMRKQGVLAVLLMVAPRGTVDHARGLPIKVNLSHEHIHKHNHKHIHIHNRKHNPKPKPKPNHN
jgi:hypothetical protein